MELYPLKFRPIQLPKIWGKETWILSAYGQYKSQVINGYLAGNELDELVEVYMGELIGDSLFERFGGQFPLLLKIIDASDDLSVQVHPDDDYAIEHNQSLGKSEMWYVLSAEKDAEIILGLKDGVSSENVIQSLEQGNLTDYLNHLHVREGDVAFIPAGTVHTLRAGVRVAEIQQASDVTYRLYDYNRRDSEGQLRQLHIKDALNVIDFDNQQKTLVPYTQVQNGAANLLQNELFTANLLCFNQPIGRDYAPLDSFVAYILTEGDLLLEQGGNKVSMSQGECVLIPASADEVMLYPQNKQIKLLEVYVCEN